MNGERRFEVPIGLTLESTGYGALQARRHMDTAWGVPTRAAFTRQGVPPVHGRGDAA